MPLDTKKIIQNPLPENQYYKEECAKKVVVLHHTVSGDGVAGDINYWKTTPEKIATCVLIERNGKIYQCFSSRLWAHHIGCKTSIFTKFGLPDINVQLNKQSIGIEIDSWGGLVKDDKGEWRVASYDTTLRKFVPNYKVAAIPANNVQVYEKGYRGFYGFEKYTAPQIQSVKELLEYWKETYKIPLTYNPDIWDVSKRALSGEAGVFVHCSYRTDKSDLHPQPEIIEMLKSLT